MRTFESTVINWKRPEYQRESANNKVYTETHNKYPVVTETILKWFKKGK